MMNTDDTQNTTETGADNAEKRQWSAPKCTSLMVEETLTGGTVTGVENITASVS